MTIRARSTKIVFAAALAILFVRVALAATARDAHSETSGSPSQWDPDLSTPFSISGQVFGFPGIVIAGIDSIEFTIPQLSNPTGSSITAQVYFASTTVTAPDGTHQLLPSTSSSNGAVPIDGCTITVAAGFNGSYTGDCEVSDSDVTTLESLNIFNPNSTTQNMNWGLGPEAKNLVFGTNDSQQVSLTIYGPDPSLSCYSPRFGYSTFVIGVDVNTPAPLAQICYIDDIPAQTVSATVSTSSGGNWLAANIDTSSNLNVNVNPNGLAIGPYSGSVVLTTNANLTLTIPVTLNILPLTPQFIQTQAKLSQSGSTYQGTSVTQTSDWLLVGATGETAGTRNGGGWLYEYSGSAGQVWTAYSDYTYQSIGQAMEGASVAGSTSGPAFLAGGPGDNGGVGAAWIIGPGTKLLGSNAIGKSNQGISVAMSGDASTALVGGDQDNNAAGAVWVFTDSQSTWTQQQKIVAGDAIGAAKQGSSVALSSDGNTALIGGSGDNGGTGAAWVFVRSNGSWTEQAKLMGSGASGSAGQGTAVALSADGNTAIVGGPMDSNAMGAAWVFTRSGANWTQISQGKLVGSGASGSHIYQGSSVALSADGSTAAIGGNGDNNSAGAAWVFQRSGNNWTQFAGKVTANDSVGAAQQGPVALSSDGSMLLLGGPGDNSNVGASWVFSMSGPAPVLTGISPMNLAAGGPTFTLTVNGMNFQSGALVQWNNDVLVTAFVSPTQLTATVQAYEIGSTGTATVYVANPDGGVSAAGTFSIEGANLTGSITHVGNFVFGQNGALYTIQVSNVGTLATTGTVTVADTIPAGVTVVSMTGQGWNCNLSTATCTNTNSLPPGSSYASILVSVNVAANAGTPLFSWLLIGGGGSPSLGTWDYAYLVAVSSCNVNADSSTDVSDIQAVVNEALGKASPAHDVTGDGYVNVLDAQMVINAVLGLGCGGS